MALKIRYVSGLDAGKELSFDDAVQEVRFGRGLKSDVPFPDDLTVVSHEHFGLRKEYGGYKFIINPEKPVFMNGRPLYDDQALPGEAELQLGSPTGPKLKIERVEGHGSNQLKTDILRPQREMAHDLRTTTSRGNRTAVMAATVALLVVLVAGGGYLIAKALRQDVTQTQGQIADTQNVIADVQNQITQIKTDLPAVRAELAKLQETNFDAAGIIAKNKESVYLVEQMDAKGREISTATASVVQLADGTKALATNGHVAAMFEDLATDPALKGGKVIAIQSKAPDYTIVEVTSVRVHPGYKLFGTWANSYRNRAAVAAAQPMSFDIPGYDVALLFVKDSAKLGPALSFAPTEAIDALKAGDPLISIGYPAEGLIGTDQQHPDPTSQTGRVVSMTTFFLESGAAARNQLVQHSVPSAGGASGSAMFNSKGEIVAFLNAGNVAGVMNGARIGNAAMVNYGQRADLMLDVIADKAADSIPDIQAQIDAADKRFSLTPEQQLARIQDKLEGTAKGAENVKRVGEFEGTMSTDVPELGSPKNFVSKFNLLSKAFYVFVITSDDGRPVIGVLAGGDKMAQSPGAAGITWVAINNAAPGELTFIGADYNAATGGAPAATDGKIKVTVYQLPFQDERS